MSVGKVGLMIVATWAVVRDKVRDLTEIKGLNLNVRYVKRAFGCYVTPEAQLSRAVSRIDATQPSAASLS